MFDGSELNPEQLEAATHPGGPLLVLAGAGTGKTTTLCARVEWLLTSGGVAPERVLLLTFTRRAAREMMQRAAARTPAARRIVGGTFHAVAHRLVRAHAASLGLSPGFSLLDAGDAADVLDLLREEHGHAGSNRRFPRKHVLADIYSRTVNAQEPLRDVLDTRFPWCAEWADELAVLFRAYGARKKALGALDLDDLLLYWRALALDDVIGAAIGDAFDHVLVDEYQDVNGLQVDIVRGMRAARPDVTAVGDDFQAIYGFRSASARHILDFPQAFPGCTVVTLERNYRSSQPVLDVANAVAAQDTDGFRKVLRAQRTGGSAPSLVFCRDASEEASMVCDKVLAAREEGALLREQAVLMRTSHDSDLLELELARRQIPFVKYGGLRYLEAAHVKDFLALLRLVDNPADEMSWFRVLQLLEGVGPARARRVVNRLVTTTPAPAAPSRALHGENVQGEAPEALWAPEVRPADPLADLPSTARDLARDVLSALEFARTSTAPGEVAHVLRDALTPLVKAHYPDAAVRLEDLDALVGAAGEASSLTTFVSELLLDPPSSTQDLAGPPHLDDDWLVLSTVHSAKGLEWNAVHLLAAYDGNFPACMAAGSKEEVAEERRLMYVALTRARSSLHVYVPRRFHHRPTGRDDAHGYGRPSRFLTDEVRSKFAIVRTGVDAVPPFGAVTASRRVEVSVDELFA
jgi:DNA helicase-2/ATP-dependent DNA helicase PcrA